MKITNRFQSVGIGIACCLLFSVVADAELQHRSERLRWLQDNGFGLFVRWSVDSQLAASSATAWSAPPTTPRSRTSTSCTKRSIHGIGTPMSWRNWRRSAAPSTWSSPSSIIMDSACETGEWQTLSIVVNAPRFDGNGREIRNAMIKSAILNGRVVQQHVEVDSPTSNAAHPLAETPRAPLLLQMDHGAFALRNVRVRPQ